MQLRERDWCNVITAHEGDSAAYTWRLSKMTLGEHVLIPRRRHEKKSPRGDAVPDAPVTAVAVSRCGNFGLVGTAAGRLDRYNMQSGLHRGAYFRYMPFLGQSSCSYAGTSVRVLMAVIGPITMSNVTWMVACSDSRWGSNLLKYWMDPDILQL